MSNAEELADQFEKDGMGSHHGGKQRTKKESEMNTNRAIPAGHERKIMTKLMNADKNQKAAERRNQDQEKEAESQGNKETTTSLLRDRLESPIKSEKKQ